MYMMPVKTTVNLYGQEMRTPGQTLDTERNECV
jgi:hypothetical protein